MSDSFWYFIFFKIPISAFFIIFFGFIGGSIYREATTPIEEKRYTLNYNGNIVKCKVDFPHYSSGKMSYWNGGVNLVECADGHDYLGVTNVEIIEYPKFNCGSRP